MGLRESLQQHLARPSKEALRQAFHEVHAQPPKILAHTRAAFGAEDARRQAIAIALSKARRGT